MFGFGKKKEVSPQKNDRSRRSEEFEQRKAQNKAQLGMFMGFEDSGGGGAVPGGGGSFDVDETELENELLMLLGDKPSTNQRQPPPRPNRPVTKPVKGVDNLNFNLELDDGHEDDEDVDEDDPELHAELGEILGDPSGDDAELELEFGGADSDHDEAPTPPPKPTMSSQELLTLLHSRLLLYEEAKIAAEKAGDSGKSRRFVRGIKTIKELQGQAKGGRVVNEADIPPEVSVKTASAPKVVDPMPIQRPPQDLMSPSPQLPEKKQMQLPEPLKPTPASDLIDLGPDPPKTPPQVPQRPPRFSLPPKEPPIDYEQAKQSAEIVLREPDPAALERLKTYKTMAVLLKRNQETSEALHYLKLSKTLEALLNSGQNVDLINEFPPVPSKVGDAVDVILPPTQPMETEQIQGHSDVQEQQQEPGSSLPPVEIDIFHAPPPPRTVLEALEQRLEKYKSEVDKANAASNSSKARRMGRIVKQYEDTISSYKKGKIVPYDDLPTPPGFGSIPIPSSAGQAPSVSVGGQSQAATSGPVNKVQVLPTPDDSSAASPEKRVKPGPSTSSGSPSQGLTASGSSTSSINRGAVGGKPMTKLTLQEKQLQEVLLRQKQYREAAIEAKKRGDIAQAREYLRVSKGFDNLIEASKSGLPVDLKTLPTPPNALSSLEAEDFELVSDQDCIIPEGGNLAEVFTKLEQDLKEQLKMCMRTREHFKNIGDVASANRFEQMALETKKDLDALRLAAKSGQSAPKYHYENRVFSITECNTDLKEDEIEITVLRGVNYKANSSIDTFVRVELPYPTVEEAQSQKSAVVKDSVDPEYNATYKMSINRSARNFQRFVHRHGVKIEVWSKGGFLRSSTLFGSATAKLQPLENKTTLHDAFDVLDGRKIVGKVEVKIRLRDPVLTKQIVQKKEKWLSIDRA